MNDDTGYVIRLVVGGAAMLYLGPSFLFVIGLAVLFHLLGVVWIVFDAKNPHSADTTAALDDLGRIYPFAIRAVHFFFTGLALYYREGRAADRAVRAYDGARERIPANAS